MDTREVVATTLAGMFTPRQSQYDGMSVLMTNAEQVHLAAMVRHRVKTIGDVLTHNERLVDLLDEVERTSKSVWLAEGLTADLLHRER